MGMNLIDLPDDLEKRRNCWYWDDFFAYLDTYTWTKGQTGTGTTVAINSSKNNGWISLGNAGSTTNAEAWFANTNTDWQLQGVKPLILEARINYQEANGTNGGIFIGFSSAFATGLLVNTTLFPKLTSMSTVGFVLAAGQTNWYVVTQIGTTQILTQTAQIAGVAGDQLLRLEVKPVGTNVEVDFLIANAETAGGADSVAPVGFQQCQETASGFLKPIKHRIAYAGAAQMSGGFFVKQASTTAETLNVDYVGLLNLR